LSARWIGLAGAALAALVLGACAVRPELPVAVEPLTPTPDAPFRYRSPALAEVKLPPFDVERRTLPNGLAVAYVRREGVPGVSIAVVNRAAGSSGPCGVELSALTAHALVRGGTSWHGSILSDLEVDGVKIAVETNPDASVLRLNVGTAEMDAALEVLARTIQAPAFSSGGVAVARRDLVDAAQASDDGAGLVWEFALREAMGRAAGALGHPSASRLDEIDATAIRGCHRNAFYPGASAVVLSGPLSSEVVFDAIERYFGGWSGAPERDYTPSPIVFEQPHRDRRIALVLAGEASSRTAVFLAQRGPAATAPDFATGLVVSKALAGEYDSRLNRALRHEQGATYGVSASLAGYRQFGLFFVRANFPPSLAADPIERLLMEIERLRREDLSSAEIAMARLRLRVELADELSSAAGATEWLVNESSIDAPGLLANLDRALAAVDAASVRRFAAAYLPVTDLVVVGRRPELLAGLRNLGTVTEYVVR
jgi:predicted Zn-dependent peptidase